MNTPLTRRRFFAIAALTAAGATAPFLLNRNRPVPLPTTGDPVIWKGIALGSGTELRLFGVDRKEAEILVNKVLAEVARLEKIFSLYREDSLINRLNKEGRLNNPPPDFLALLSICRDIHALTDGAFDPTVQVLWNLYADHFRRNPRAETPPSEPDIRRTLKLVGLKHVVFDQKAILFEQKGMGLSLNGIAQGYITDKVTALLQQHGIRQALVDMGEIRGFDTDNQRTWNVGIRNPQNEEATLLTIPMQNQAFATSGGYGTVMDEAGKFTHLFDPRTGTATPRYRSVSVMAPTASVADAFSTAFSIMDESAIRTAARAKQAKVWLVMPDNRIETLA